jgi:hypothetical protein
MRHAVGLGALAALGLLSGVTYALAVPIGPWLGVEPLTCHPAVVAVLFALYLGALWLVFRRLSSTPRVLGVILGFALLFRTVLLLAVTAALAWISRAHALGVYDTWRATGLAIGAWLVLGPFSVHPWYVLWMVPFLCVKPSPAWLYFSGAVVLSYTKYLVPSGRMPWWAWLGEYAPLYALLAAGTWRSAFRAAAAPLAMGSP